MQRRLLDPLYRISEIIAACLFFVIFAMILLQVALSLADRVMASAGMRSPGVFVPSYAEFAGYLMVAASFMGLAGALRAQAHVQVTLILHSVPAGLRRIMETMTGFMATAASAYFCWRVFRMILESWRFGDTSYGTIAVPMWIPQTPMALGLAVLTIAFADFTLAAMTGKTTGARPDTIDNAAERN